MGEGCEIKHFEKIFANCKIVWNIENFSFAIPPEINPIRSPEFKLKVIQVTRWRLNVELKCDEAEDGCISMFLERLPHPGPDVVWANWEITAIAGSKQYAPIEHSYYFDQNSKKGVRLQSITDVVANFGPFEPDTFRIECKLIVRKLDEIVKMPKPVHSGIKSLSDDLKKMFKDMKYHDVTIRIDEQCIRAHKTVLSRNKVFRCLIEKAKNGVIELENLDYEAVSKLSAFMYTGNMEFILGSPSVAMHKCVEFFNCDVLMCFFAPEQLNMHTKIETDEHEVHWIIKAFSERKDKCISPIFKGLNTSTTWRLHFHTNAEDNNGYFSIFAEIVLGMKPKYFCLEFAVEDASGFYSYPNRMMNFSNRHNAMGFQEFVKISDLENSNLFNDDALNVVFKVRTFQSSQKTSLGARIESFITIPKESTYEKLSSEMEDLLNRGQFSDIILQSETEKFNVHKCILSARSPSLLRILQDMSIGSNIFIFTIIDGNVLRILLRYLYSGVLENIELKDLLQLYKASVSYSILCLKEACIKALKEKNSNDGTTTVLEMAKSLGLESLISDVI